MNSQSLISLFPKGLKSQSTIFFSILGFILIYAILFLRQDLAMYPRQTSSLGSFYFSLSSVELWVFTTTYSYVLAHFNIMNTSCCDRGDTLYLCLLYQYVVVNCRREAAEGLYRKSKHGSHLHTLLNHPEDVVQSFGMMASGLPNHKVPQVATSICACSVFL